MLKEKEVHSAFKYSPNTMVKWVQIFNKEISQSQSLTKSFKELDDFIKKDKGNSKTPQYSLENLRRLCNESQEFSVVLQQMLTHDFFDIMVDTSKEINQHRKDIYKNELREYYKAQLQQNKDKFKNLMSKNTITYQFGIYKDRKELEAELNLIDSQQVIGNYQYSNEYWDIN